MIMDLSRGISADLQNVRKDMRSAGIDLTDQEFNEAVDLACRKTAVTGMDESYLPFLLPDVIREMAVRREINNITASVMAGCRI